MRSIGARRLATTWSKRFPKVYCRPKCGVAPGRPWPREPGTSLGAVPCADGCGGGTRRSLNWRKGVGCVSSDSSVGVRCPSPFRAGRTTPNLRAHIRKHANIGARPIRRFEAFALVIPKRNNDPILESMLA